jgi:nicotinate phosphoribosyltransferase|uniref:Nicotinate phosphoribosyltransferase n=1 Tax=Desulfobacca acetoxidans TaxID=60893 RepID=A0A7C5ELU2_9BACT
MKQAPLGERLALLTDLYQLTMAACYFDQGMNEEATFSLFIRKYPKNRGYFVAAGLSEALEYLETLRFTEEDLAYLETTGLFSSRFLDFLKGVRFTGEVFALPEGSIFFKDEPILEVSAPIIEAQLVETFIINAVSLQTLIATKAARSIYAAKGRPVIDFSLRRTQGSDAGLKVARASYLTGFLGTSNVLAGKLYGIPIFGTMAHSYITSFPEEIEAFRVFAKNFPKITTLLIDTYNDLVGAQKAAKVGKEMEARGERLRFVRLDSGDIADLSRKVRKILDEAGLNYVRLLASGGFDEFKIAEVLAQGGVVDAFAVGTKMGVSADEPYFDIAYKLVKYAGRPVMKLSTGKVTLVDKKQVWRHVDEKGQMLRDTIALREETLSDGEPLLKPVMRHGRLTGTLPTLKESRDYFQEQFARLPEPLKALENPPPFPVDLSPGLKDLQARVEQTIRRRELGES